MVFVLLINTSPFNLRLFGHRFLISVKYGKPIVLGNHSLLVHTTSVHTTSVLTPADVILTLSLYYRPTRPDKARRLGYKNKQGVCIYRTRVKRGGRKKPVAKGICYGKPKTSGVNQLKFQRSIQSVAEERVGRACGGLRVLNRCVLFCSA